MKRLTLTLAALATLTMAFDAAAWAHRKTDNGKSVRWERAEVTLTLDSSLAALGDLDAVEAAIDEALGLWSERADLPVDFVIVRGDCGDLGYTQGQENANCLLADESWAREGEDVGATTVLTFQGKSGVIVDADIVFNAMEWRWAIGGQVEDIEERTAANHGNGSNPDDEPLPVLSFDTVVVHELGHLLGLAHSDVDDAIMYPTTQTGIVEGADLSLDDVDGAVALYEGLEDKLAEQGMGAGCQAVPGSAQGSFAPLLALLGLLFAARQLAPARLRRR